MLASLIFGRKTPNKIGTIELDLTLSETHDYANNTTEFPTESGTTVSDHIRAELRTFTLEGWFTNSPVKYLDLEYDPFGESRAQTALAKIIEVFTTKEPIDVQTSLGLYEGFVFTRLSIPRTADLGEAVKFTATFKEMTRVDVVTVKMVADGKRVKGVDKQSVKTVNTGKNLAAKTKNGSIISKALDAAKGWAAK